MKSGTGQGVSGKCQAGEQEVPYTHGQIAIGYMGVEEYRPVVPVTESGEGSAQQQSATNPFDALIERQRLNLPDINEYWYHLNILGREKPIIWLNPRQKRLLHSVTNTLSVGYPELLRRYEYCLMWSDLRLETSRGRVPEEIRQMVIHVSNGLDFVLFEKLNLTQQASILGELQWHREGEGIEQFELTYEEGMILRDAAAAVNIAYDPGTPEEIEKRTFTFLDLEAKASPEALTLRDWYASHNNIRA